MKAFLCGMTAVVVCVGAGRAADWPQWRGADQSGVAEAEDFDPNFAPNGKPKLLWTRNVGTGYSPVTIAGGYAYTAGWSHGKDFVHCLDAKTGKPRWTFSYESKLYDIQHAGGPSDAVAVDDERAFHFSRDGRLFCIDTDTGQKLWERHLARDYRIADPKWMFSGSAVVADETVYLDAGRILALDPADGAEKWKTPDFGAAYSTPVPFALHGKDLLAAFPKAGLVIVERDTGRVVTTHPWDTQYGVNAATPIVHGDKVFISSGYSTGCAVLQLTGDGLRLVWEGTAMHNQLPTSVLIGDHLYGFDDKQLKCIALADGKEQWAQRGLGMGTLIAAGDTLIVLSEDGELITAPASPQQFAPTARARVFDEGSLWVMPTFADGLIYCRAPTGAVVCIDTAAQ